MDDEAYLGCDERMHTRCCCVIALNPAQGIIISDDGTCCSRCVVFCLEMLLRGCYHIACNYVVDLPPVECLDHFICASVIVQSDMYFSTALPCLLP